MKQSASRKPSAVLSTDDWRTVDVDSRRRALSSSHSVGTRPCPSVRLFATRDVSVCDLATVSRRNFRRSHRILRRFRLHESLHVTTGYRLETCELIYAGQRRLAFVGQRSSGKWRLIYSSIVALNTGSTEKLFLKTLKNATPKNKTAKHNKTLFREQNTL